MHEKSFIIHEHKLTLSLSIGIAIYPHSGIDTATLLKNANVAMYDAKAKELNSVSIYDDVIAKKIERRLRLEKIYQTHYKMKNCSFCINLKLIVNLIKLSVQKL